MKMPKLYSIKDDKGVIHILMAENISDASRQYPNAVEILEKEYSLTATAVNMVNKKK